MIRSSSRTLGSPLYDLLQCWTEYRQPGVSLFCVLPINRVIAQSPPAEKTIDSPVTDSYDPIINIVTQNSPMEVRNRPLC